MHGFHCRAAVQSGCDLSSALTPLPGRAATAGTAALQGGIPNGPPAEASPSGATVRPFHQGSSFHLHQDDQSKPTQMGNSLTDGEVLALLCYDK